MRVVPVIARRRGRKSVSHNGNWAAVVIGTVEIRVNLPDARTLKDKRRVLKSLKDSLRNRFNITVAEVEGQDFIQSATLAVAQVSNDRRYVNGSLDKVVAVVQRFPSVRLVDYHIQIQ